MYRSELDSVHWRKSKRSNGNGGNNCVEVAILATSVAVRDTKDVDGPVLRFSPTAWAAFVADPEHLDAGQKRIDSA